MAHDSHMADFYVDETEIPINGRTCLVYGIVVPSGLDEATTRLFDLEYQLGLDRALEIRGGYIPLHGRSRLWEGRQADSRL